MNARQVTAVRGLPSSRGSYVTPAGKRVSWSRRHCSPVARSHTRLASVSTPSANARMRSTSRCSMTVPPSRLHVWCAHSLAADDAPGAASLFAENRPRSPIPLLELRNRVDFPNSSSGNSDLIRVIRVELSQPVTRTESEAASMAVSVQPGWSLRTRGVSSTTCLQCRRSHAGRPAGSTHSA